MTFDSTRFTFFELIFYFRTEVTVMGIEFGKHVLSIKYDDSHITVTRIDRLQIRKTCFVNARLKQHLISCRYSLSEPVYVMDSSHAAVVLGIKQAFRFADDVVYLSNSLERYVDKICPCRHSALYCFNLCLFQCCLDPRQSAGCQHRVTRARQGGL